MLQQRITAARGAFGWRTVKMSFGGTSCCGCFPLTGAPPLKQFVFAYVFGTRNCSLIAACTPKAPARTRNHIKNLI